MSRSVITSVMAGAILLSLGTAAFAATGQFHNMCTMGLASHKIVNTNCSVSTIYRGKTYCFGNEQARAAFLQNPKANLAKAEAFYKTQPRG